MTKDQQFQILDKICPLEKGYKTSKRQLRLKFFQDIQTEIQAYLLGFHAADGSVDEKRHTLRVCVAKNDREITSLFAQTICPDARHVLLHRQNVKTLDRITKNSEM